MVCAIFSTPQEGWESPKNEILENGQAWLLGLPFPRNPQLKTGVQTPMLLLWPGSLYSFSLEGNSLLRHPNMDNTIQYTRSIVEPDRMFLALNSSRN